MKNCPVLFYFNSYITNNRIIWKVNKCKHTWNTWSIVRMLCDEQWSELEENKSVWFVSAMFTENWLTIFHELKLLYSILMMFGKFIVQFFVHKRVFGLPPQGFLKTIFRKANWWTVDVLIGLFWSFYGNLELFKVRNIHSKVSKSAFSGRFHLEAQSIVW